VIVVCHFESGLDAHLLQKRDGLDHFTVGHVPSQVVILADDEDSRVGLHLDVKSSEVVGIFREKN
jgi:hypothetical protein